MNGTACTSDSSNAPSGSYKPTVLKNDSCACVVVHEEIDTTTCRIILKIMKEGDGRAIAVAAVVQSTASGTSLSMDTVLSVTNDVSNVKSSFTAATCKTKAVPLLVSSSLYLFLLYLLKFENRSGR